MFSSPSLLLICSKICSSVDRSVSLIFVVVARRIDVSVSITSSSNSFGPIRFAATSAGTSSDVASNRENSLHFVRPLRRFVPSRRLMEILSSPMSPIEHFPLGIPSFSRIPSFTTNERRKPVRCSSLTRSRLHRSRRSSLAQTDQESMLPFQFLHFDTFLSLLQGQKSRISKASNKKKVFLFRWQIDLLVNVTNRRRSDLRGKNQLKINWREENEFVSVLTSLSHALRHDFSKRNSQVSHW